MFFINDSGNARYKRCRKQNPGFGVREQQRPHFITYKRVKTLSLHSISSTAMRLLWLVYHVVGKIQAYKLWCLIHSKVFVIPTAISPAAITTVSGTLFFLLCVHSHCRLHCGQHPGRRQASCHGCDTHPPSLPCPFSVLAPVTSVIIVLVTTAFLITPSSSSPVQPPQTRVCGPAGCASLPYVKFSINQTATQ